ncbi:NAD(P)-dependent dehydrogenase (short-subunit alcohol dehydrogenase family) [Novosphingobium fluoreni]|uniref:NAD(P)-dependent dehydrogenase (Short-subunit alcohol dehydrogenase family) n=1 Tax=Novosphingobium fluoreni TaxID=1391222 RepID=A0A7W6FYR4_9SPHN|nr:SDR family NAD(P)-dependent oxidoreductase [Novosphingobium fluoreni]KTR83611.1 short-chain dehydrogenase [Novosphingobium barchaimii]MBB3940320.1 NAD(P)-dependent dehydrogenase (short-subunit alcohol dehydrogenase family) [Novosphingobium fluoreni]
MTDLSNRVVLITGASSGLGACFARAASENGAAVALAARRADRLADLKAEIEAKGGRAVAVEMDVADEASVSAGFDAAQAALGPVNSVIANAGMNYPSSALGIPIAEFDKVMDVNLRGVFITAREAAKRMIAAGSPQSGDGRIVLVGSVGSHRVLEKLVAYNASKAAVLMMGKALAKEWAQKGINVNVVCPGWIATELNSEWLASPAGQALIESFPRKRAMEPADLLPPIMLLLSDAARTITGASFELDDGQSL